MPLSKARAEKLNGSTESLTSVDKSAGKTLSESLAQRTITKVLKSDKYLIDAHPEAKYSKQVQKLIINMAPALVKIPAGKHCKESQLVS